MPKGQQRSNREHRKPKKKKEKESKKAPQNVTDLFVEASKIGRSGKPPRTRKR